MADRHETSQAHTDRTVVESRDDTGIAQRQQIVRYGMIVESLISRPEAPPLPETWPGGKVKTKQITRVEPNPITEKPLNPSQVTLFQAVNSFMKVDGRGRRGMDGHKFNELIEEIGGVTPRELPFEGAVEVMPDSEPSGEPQA